MTDKLIEYYKQEEREHILGIIEFMQSELGDSTYENYVRKKFEELIHIIEKN